MAHKKQHTIHSSERSPGHAHTAGQAVFYNSLPLSGCYLPHSALFPPKSVCPSSPPETVSISAADPPHTEPIPGSSHTAHQCKNQDNRRNPLNKEMSSYFRRRQGWCRSCSSGFGRIPVSAAPRKTLMIGTHGFRKAFLFGFSQETPAHILFLPESRIIASTEYGVSPAAVTSSPGTKMLTIAACSGFARD